MVSCYSPNNIVSSHVSYAFFYSLVCAVVIAVSVSFGTVTIAGGGGGTAVIVLLVIKWRNKKEKVVSRRQWAKPCLAVRAHTHNTHIHTPCMHIQYIQFLFN